MRQVCTEKPLSNSDQKKTPKGHIYTANIDSVLQQFRCGGSPTKDCGICSLAKVLFSRDEHRVGGLWDTTAPLTSFKKCRRHHCSGCDHTNITHALQLLRAHGLCLRDHSDNTFRMKMVGRLCLIFCHAPHIAAVQYAGALLCSGSAPSWSTSPRKWCWGMLVWNPGLHGIGCLRVTSCPLCFSISTWNQPGAIIQQFGVKCHSTVIGMAEAQQPEIKSRQNRGLPVQQPSTQVLIHSPLREEVYSLQVLLETYLNQLWLGVLMPNFGWCTSCSHIWVGWILPWLFMP